MLESAAELQEACGLPGIKSLNFGLLIKTQRFHSIFLILKGNSHISKCKSRFSTAMGQRSPSI